MRYTIQSYDLLQKEILRQEFYERDHDKAVRAFEKFASSSGGWWSASLCDEECNLLAKATVTDSRQVTIRIQRKGNHNLWPFEMVIAQA